MNPHGSRDFATHRTGLAYSGPDFFERHAEPRRQTFTGGRGADTACRSVQELDANKVFQSADRFTER
ncbi:hypothetical protein GCM10022398_24440 [Acetobacter lovaniensis]|nr:hypothetical protein AA0474_0391 [Acetobacter lovaniensis NRIC 0474]